MKWSTSGNLQRITHLLRDRVIHIVVDEVGDIPAAWQGCALRNGHTQIGRGKCFRPGLRHLQVEMVGEGFVIRSQYRKAAVSRFSGRK